MEQLKPTILIFLGPPGSGKGTQALLLAEKYRLPLMVTGDVMRQEAGQKTTLGKITKQLIDRGKLVPTKLWEKIVAQHIEQINTDKGIIIDGSPRNKAQVPALNRTLANTGLAKIYAIYLELHPTVATKRLLRRTMCSVCHQPMLPGIKKCSRCGGKVIKRADDDLKVIKDRFRVYQQKTAPLIDYYHERGELLKINGDQSINKVHRDILGALKNEGVVLTSQTASFINKSK